MKLNVTIELIPITRYPRQGTIIGDVIYITKKKIEVGLHSDLTKTFFEIGDAVPIIIRSHIYDDIEVELEAVILDVGEINDGESSLLLEISGANEEIENIEKILLLVNNDREIIKVFKEGIR